jgi:hypothetical protein
LILPSVIAGLLSPLLPGLSYLSLQGTFFICHCEKRSDEAISVGLLGLGIAMP